MAYALPVIEEVIPPTYRKVEISSESKMLKDTMIKKMNSLRKNNTWELLELPKGKKMIDCKWVFVKKHGPLDSDTVRYKAKLVAKGYT